MQRHCALFSSDRALAESWRTKLATRFKGTYPDEDVSGDRSLNKSRTLTSSSLRAPSAARRRAQRGASVLLSRRASCSWSILARTACPGWKPRRKICRRRSARASCQSSESSGSLFFGVVACCCCWQEPRRPLRALTGLRREGGGAATIARWRVV